MRNIFFIFVVILLSYSSIYSLSTWELRFSENVYVNKDDIYLKDISEFIGNNIEIENSLKDIFISRSPLYGKKRILRKGLIISILKANNIDVNHLIVPAKIICKRKIDNKIHNSSIVYKKIEKLFPEETKLTYVNTPDLYHININKLVEVKISHKYKNKYFINVKYTDLNGNSLNKNFIVMASLLKKRRVAVKDLKKGERFSLDKTEIKNINILSKEIIYNDDENIKGLSGKVCKNKIKKGQIIYSRLFREPDIIKKNDIVNCLLKLNGINMNITAKAKQNGKKGDIINVSFKNKVLKGKIVNEGEIQLLQM